MIQLEFHGGAGTVTGSKHLLRVAPDNINRGQLSSGAVSEGGSESVLIDCGMFQGLKELRERNWKEPPFNPSELKCLLLTHAHLDHSGWIPRLVKHGFSGPIYCTAGTRDVAEIILMDSAHLQQEEADFRNSKGISSHNPALPLYTQEDVQKALSLFKPVDYHTWIDASPQISFYLIDVGHILGSSAIQIKVKDQGKETRILASGDVGRYHMPLHPDPENPLECDALILESTYGDRAHSAVNPEDQLLDVALKAYNSRGLLLIPAFAVGRSQQVIFVLHHLFDTGRLPRMPIYLDSPMGVDATKIYCQYSGQYRFDPESLKNGVCTLFGEGLKVVKTHADSMKLSTLKGPAVIISSNGMLTGGRILNHLKNVLPHPNNIIALVGYQAVGTRGRYLAEGAKTLRILREEIPVQAQVADLKGFSGHADADELLKWTSGINPKRCFLVHGEPASAQALAARIRKDRPWNVEVAQLDQVVNL